MTDNDGGIDRERLKAITERVQMGDAEEGAEALEEVISLARASDRNQTRQVMRDEFAEMGRQAENRSALAKLAKKYPTLMTDEDLVDVAKTRLRREIVTDLKAGGGLTDELLEPIKNDTDRLVGAHGHARSVGANVRSTEKLLFDTMDGVAEKYGIKPAGTGRTHAEYIADLRTERGFKRQDDGLRDAGGSRAPGSGSLTADQAQKAATYVEKLRQARGFAPRTPR
jgi:hypothetical protein